MILVCLATCLHFNFCKYTQIFLKFFEVIDAYPITNTISNEVPSTFSLFKGTVYDISLHYGQCKKMVLNEFKVVTLFQT